EKKAGLVDRTAGLIGDNPRAWMYMLTESDLMLLRDLVSAGPGQWVELLNPDYPYMLEMLNLIYIDDTDKDFVYASLDEALYSHVASIIDHVIAEKRVDGSFETERLALGLLNLYGVITVEGFVQQAFDMMDDGSNRGEQFARIAENRLVAIQRATYKGEMYLVSPYAYEFEKLIDGWAEFPDTGGFASFTKEEAMHAGSDAPFCAFGYGTPEYNAAWDVLEDLGYERQDILDCLNEVWVNAQYAMDEACAEALFSCVNDRINEIDTFDEYRRYIDTIAAYANSVPKWLLKGHSSTESNLLKLSIKVDEASFEEEIPGEEQAKKGPDELPGPLNELYRYSMAVRHVGPDDPCPCGSGLSYRRCHGKNLN
ncbi:MAG: SEC-C domain-containing protein, partial [Bacteroidales bacterium]|nr:SEC-C domain-containing protein [Bacteroidales bacterium]